MKSLAEMIMEKRMGFTGEARYFTFDVNEAFLMLNILQIFKQSDKYADLHKDLKNVVDELIDEYAEYVESRKDRFVADNEQYVQALAEFEQTGKWQNYEKGRMTSKGYDGKEYDFDTMMLKRAADDASERLKKWTQYTKNIDKVFKK